MIGGVVCAKKPRAPVAPGVPSAGQAAVRVSSGKPGRRFPRHQGLARRAGARVGHSGGAYKPKEGVHRKDWLPGRASSRTRRTPPGVMSGHCTNKLWYIERAGRMMGGYRLTAVGAPCRGAEGLSVRISCPGRWDGLRAGHVRWDWPRGGHRDELCASRGLLPCDPAEREAVRRLVQRWTARPVRSKRHEAPGPTSRPGVRGTCMSPLNRDMPRAVGPES
jgi:hypothetical protein